MTLCAAWWVTLLFLKLLYLHLRKEEKDDDFVPTSDGESDEDSLYTIQTGDLLADDDDMDIIEE